MKLRLLKTIDRHLASRLVYLFPRPGRKEVAIPGRILFIRPGGIGDAALLLPVIRSVAGKYPDAKIDILAEKRNAAVFEMCDPVADVYQYDRFAGLVSVLGSRYDVVIDTEQWHYMSALVARLVRSQIKIGFATNSRSRMFSDPVDYMQDDYELDSFGRLLAPLGVDMIPVSEYIDLDADIRSRTVFLLDGLAGKGIVALFPGASIPERKWGSIKFAELASRIESCGFGVVVIGGPQDHETGEQIVSALENSRNLAGRCTLAESSAVIEASTALVTGDSGILHIGVGLDKPTVSLFGPGIEKKWAPRGNRHRVINKHLDCSPCTIFGNTPDCPVGIRCMKEIQVEEVFSTMMDLLEQEGLS
jgi:lipopolysaccharide heptosyltransferase II